MKKISIFFYVFVLSSFLFAETFQEKFNKAKTYEEEKKYVYALANYYDAKGMVDNNSDDFINVEEKYENIKEMIKEGKPGLEDFDTFELYDKWMELLQEFEQYWSEYCPLKITIHKAERQSVDMENRTGVYSITVYAQRSEKYYDIKEIISSGLENAMSTNRWNNDNLRYFWPDYSVYNIISKDPNDYIPNNTPLIYTPYDAKLEGAYKSFHPDFKLFSPAVVLHYYEKIGSSYSTDDSTCILPYLCKVNIFDLEGNIISESNYKYFKGGYLSIFQITYEFTLSESQIKLIDNGNYKIKLAGLINMFGKISEENVIVTTNNDWVKTLKSKGMALNKALIYIQKIK